MAEKRVQVEQMIFKALAGLNEERESDQQILISANTPLFGATSALDSLSLVSIIVDVETAVSDQFGCAIALTDDRALSQPISPFSSVAALTDYTVELLNQQAA